MSITRALWAGEMVIFDTNRIFSNQQYSIVIEQGHNEYSAIAATTYQLFVETLLTIRKTQMHLIGTK